MTFLNPILLGAGAACVAIPIVIHLLMRRRRKPVRWAAMRFLLEAYRQRQRRVRLEQFLLLAARCLLIALIALAVGRPVLDGAGVLGSGSREVYLLVDTSLGSAIRGTGGESELAASVERALALLDRLDGARGDRAALIALGGPAEPVVLPATSDLALVERRLRGLRPTDSTMDLAGGLALVPTGGHGSDPALPVVAVLSAFREGSVARAPALGVLEAGVRLMADPPAQEPLGNVGLGALDLLRPVVVTGGGAEGLGGGVAQVRATLVRSGAGLDRAESSTVWVVAQRGGSPREVGSAVVRWTPGQTDAQTTVDIDLGGLVAAGRVVLRAEIDRDANERDNMARAVLEVRERLGVAVLGSRRFGARPRITDFSPSDWLRLALEPVGHTNGRPAGEQIGVEVLDAGRFEGGQLAGFDAVIVAEPGRVRAEGWASLGAFRARGGAVLLTASPTPGAQLWTEAASSALGLDWGFDREPIAIEEEGRGLAVRPTDGDDLLWFLRSELAALAETVSVERVLGVEVRSGGEVLLATSGGSPVLVATGSGSGVREGVVVLLATAIDLEWTDLPARPLMVPLIQEIVRSGVGRGPSRRIVAAGSRVAAPAGAVEVENREADEAVAVDPSTGLTRTPIRSAGAYVARNAGGLEVGAVVVQPAAEAGRAAAVDRERVGAWLGSAVGVGGSLAWSDAAAVRAGGDQGDRGAEGPGPGLMLLAGALGVACVELWLARGVSHAGREVGGASA